MSSIQIEINNKGKYKMVEYFEPGYFKELNDGSSLINDFLIFCEKELAGDIYSPPNQFYQPRVDSALKNK